MRLIIGTIAALAALSCFAQAFQRHNFARAMAKRPFTQLNLFGFLNDGKKALVKSLAGEYDQAAIQARIQGLVDSNSVFMFSFTT